MIILGADHRGFKLKTALKTYLQKKGVLVMDCGTFNEDSADYPVYSYQVAKRVAKSGGKHRGIVICGNGVGASIVANKVKGAYCPIVDTISEAKQSREHGNVNIIALRGDSGKQKDAFKIVDAWLETKFSRKKRYLKRLQQVQKYEKMEFK